MRKTIKYDKKHEHELEILWENMRTRLENNKITDDDFIIFLGHSLISKIRQREMVGTIQDRLFEEIRGEPAISSAFTQIREILLEGMIDDKPKQAIRIKQKEIDSKVS